MSKTPNLRQPCTCPIIYPAMKLPPMVSVPLQPAIARPFARPRLHSSPLTAPRARLAR
jgi:hypothetical protein